MTSTEIIEAYGVYDRDLQERIEAVGGYWADGHKRCWIVPEHAAKDLGLVPLRGVAALNHHNVDAWMPAEEAARYEEGVRARIARENLRSEVIADWRA